MKTSRGLALGAVIAIVIALGQFSTNVQILAQSDNGISVGDPKIFDNRALALMLEALNESLRATTVIDGTKLAATFGNLQGFQQDAIARSFSLQGAPLPGIVETSKLTGANENLTGGATTTTTVQPSGAVTANVITNESQKATSGTENSTQTTTPARSPVTPALPGFLTPPTFTPQFGPNGGDLLTDQVNLTYQIVNLRLLLDRALTDRLYGDAPRLQAVLGFNVSLDPPRDSQDSAAFVEITLTTVPPKDGPAAEPVSVVAVMPQEKTYNSAALSNRANAFGGSAVSSVFSIGYNEQRQSQTFYLYRDNDTIAFERMSDSPTETTFGWSFRPVLGRRSVSPGARQMFAVISLPYADVKASEIPVKVSIKTYWRHFDQKLKTSSESRTFWQNMARGLSLGTAQDRPRGGDVAIVKTVAVPTTTKFQDNLTPQVGSIEWDLIGEANAMVRVRGSNFFQGTEVRLGTSRFLSAADGLTLKSDKAFDLIAPASALMSNGFVVGRYGSAEPLLDAKGRDPSTGMTITGVSVRPPLGGRSLMEIRVRARDGSPLEMSKLPGTVLIRINDTIVPPPYNLVASKAGQLEYVSLYVPEAAQASGLVTVRFPFGTDRWAASFRVYDPSVAISIVRFAPEGEKDTTTKLLITTNDQDNLFECEAPNGGVPAPEWRISLGQDYAVRSRQIGAAADPIAHRRSPRQIEFRPPTAMLDKHPLLLIDCGETVHPIAVPAVAPKPAQTTFASVTPAAVKVNDARKVTIAGKLLDRVVSVTANGFRLDSRAVDGTLEVFLTRSLTEHAGTITLVCRDDKGIILGSIDLTVQ
jgi:hypothetical protein